ncbi:MAG: acetate kinase [Bacteroidales bacterium]|nr:acetate kinase [Bacteroidales bacterium]
MKILVLNCGSSSIKYKMFEMPGGTVLAQGLAEKIGLEDGRIKHLLNGKRKTELNEAVPDHQTGIGRIFKLLLSDDYGCIRDIHEIDAVGHRVVHGGEDFTGSVLIDDEMIAAMVKNIELAPLHNPPNLEGIYSINNFLPDIPQVGVFDTAFHQTMPKYSFLYGIPYELYEKYRIRRYGFHGTSHRYVAARACELLGVDINNSKIITCHLGNGSSIAAIKDGRSIDTSMGLTPNEGLIMGTRCGDLDTGALLFIANKEGLSIEQTSNLLNKKSGVLGISGISPDMREIEDAAAEGNERAQLALDMFHYRVRKYIGAYTAALNGVDIIVFTGGIGENADLTRREVCEGLTYLGAEPDESINRGLRGKEAVISTPDSKLKIVVIPTDEELMIARDTFGLVKTLI